MGYVILTRKGARNLKLSRIFWVVLMTLYVVFMSHANASEKLGTLGYIEYTLDMEHYEVIQPNDYYMYVQTRNIDSNDICVLHIQTIRDEHTYIVTDGIVRFKNGKMQSFSKWDKGQYDDSSIIGIAIQKLDAQEENKEKGEEL